MNTIIKMVNTYVEALRGREKNTKTILSPKRQIVKDQKERCYMCEKSLGNAMCYFAEIQGPDMNTGLPSNGMRAVCATCSFALGKDPIKVAKKTKEIRAEKEMKSQKKAEEEEVNLFKELKLKHNTKDEMYDRWN